MIRLDWQRPDETGGLDLVYRLVYREMGATLAETRLTEAQAPDWTVACEGASLECVVENLVPGRSYDVRVRAQNGKGSSPDSPTLSTYSAPTVPLPPPTWWSSRWTTLS